MADYIFQSHMFLQYDFDTPPIENGGMSPPLKYGVGVELMNDTV